MTFFSIGSIFRAILRLKTENLVLFMFLDYFEQFSFKMESTKIIYDRQLQNYARTQESSLEQNIRRIVQFESRKGVHELSKAKGYKYQESTLFRIKLQTLPV